MGSSIGQHQDMATQAQSLDNVLICPKTQAEKKPRPQPDESLKCPRCDSTNTKFCYYNNYSLSQPRYFCKSCRRYWTKGGTLRNVPVGGGCRKNRRSSTSYSSSKVRAQDQEPMSPASFNFPSVAYESSDLPPFARVHMFASGHESYYDHLPYPIASHFNLTGHDQKVPSSVATSLPSGFLEMILPTSYHGFGDRTMGEVADNGGDTFYGGAIRAMKQEQCLGGESESRVLWGFPWQVNGDGNCVNLVDVANSGRGSWNGGIGSSWHGIVNSPLM